MGRLLCSQNVPFDLSDWPRARIRKVFAGTNCVMALTEDGYVLQKTKNSENAARTIYWKHITDIALSHWAEGLAIGLVDDGTCMISKKPVRSLCNHMGSSREFDRINETVRSWKDIVAVAASDAFFALGADGRVRYTTVSKLDDYKETRQWENIVRIVTGSQCSVFGIDKNGRVHVAGYNCRSGAMGDLSRKFAEMDDVVDLCVSGSECGSVYVAHRDGTVEDLRTGEKLPVVCAREPALMASHTTGVAMRESNGSLHFRSYCYADLIPEKVFEDLAVSSFALGDVEYGPTFVLAVEAD